MTVMSILKPTSAVPVNSESQLHAGLSHLSINQLDQLVKELSGLYYCFPDKPSVFEVSALIQSNSEFFVCFTDSVMGIDSVTVSALTMQGKAKEDLLTAIIKIS